MTTRKNEKSTLAKRCRIQRAEDPFLVSLNDGNDGVGSGVTVQLTMLGKGWGQISEQASKNVVPSSGVTVQCGVSSQVKSSQVT